MVQTFNLSAIELLLIFGGLDRLIIDKDGVAHFLAFCNPTRQVITASTGSWLCKNKEYKRRGN